MPEDERTPLVPRPIHDQVLVRQGKPLKTAGDSGLLLPDSVEEWATGPLAGDGVVVAVGPGRADPSRVGGRRMMSTDIVAGARVLFIRKPASALIWDNRDWNAPKEFKDLIMLREDDILGIIDP